MLTYEDCLELCDLSEEEINAIAEHEHQDPIQAIAKAEYLVCTEGGERMIRKYIIEDIRHAQLVGKTEHEKELKRTLIHFIKTHPKHGLSTSS